jgi:hypothetical protein
MRPIMLNMEMVLAVLSCRKTLHHEALTPRELEWVQAEGLDLDDQADREWCEDNLTGQPRSRLYVREAMRQRQDGRIVYDADSKPLPLSVIPDEFVPVRPYVPMGHMPRWASRITLEVTALRVRRVQDVSEDDAIAEGVYVASIHAPPPLHVLAKWVAPGVRMTNPHGEHDTNAPAHDTAKAAFECLWDHRNAKRPGCLWEDNPWVRATAFTLIECKTGAAPS